MRSQDRYRAEVLVTHMHRDGALFLVTSFVTGAADHGRSVMKIYGIWTFKLTRWVLTCTRLGLRCQERGFITRRRR